MGFVAFGVYDIIGNPLAGLAPTFVKYCDILGGSRTPPSIVDLGLGLYGFQTTTDDDDTGTAFLVDAGAAGNPRYFAGGVGSLHSFVIYDNTSAPVAGVGATFYSYVDFSGVPKSSPVIEDLGSGLYAFNPPLSDRTAGRAYEVNPSHFGAFYPEYFSGVVEPTSGGSSDSIAPTLDNFIPDVGTSIPPTGVIQFDVLDDTGLRRIVLLAAYDGVSGRELIHDGENFNQAAFSNVSNVRSTITGGYRYTVVRDGGWPGAMTLYPFAIDTSGNENA